VAGSARNGEGDGSSMASMLRKGGKGGKMVGASVRWSKGEGEGGGLVGAGAAKAGSRGRDPGCRQWPGVAEAGADQAACKQGKGGSGRVGPAWKRGRGHAGCAKKMCEFLFIKIILQRVRIVLIKRWTYQAPRF
jgi:hypothetical protein